MSGNVVTFPGAAPLPAITDQNLSRFRTQEALAASAAFELAASVIQQGFDHLSVSGIKLAPEAVEELRGMITALERRAFRVIDIITPASEETAT